MTPEMERVPLAAVRSGGEGDITSTWGDEITIKSNTSNEGRGQGRGGRGGRNGHQGRGGRGGRFNRLEYT